MQRPINHRFQPYVVGPLLSTSLLFVMLTPGCSSHDASSDTHATSSQDLPVEIVQPTWTQESFDGYFSYFATAFVNTNDDVWSVEGTEYNAAYTEFLQTSVPLPLADVLSTKQDICAEFGLASQRADYFPRGDKDIGATIPFAIGQRPHSLERASGEKGYVSYWWEPEFPVNDPETLTGSEIRLNNVSLGLEIPEALSGVSWQAAWTELETTGKMHLTWDPPSAEDGSSMLSVSASFFVDDTRSDWRNVGCWLIDDGAAYIEMGTFDYGGILYVDRLQQTAVTVDDLGLVLAAVRRGQSL